MIRPGEPDPAAPPHSQSLGWPACCQACTTAPVRLTAKSVRAPSWSEVTAGLLTRLRGELPTVRYGDQLVLPIGCCHACSTDPLAAVANHSAVVLLFMPIATLKGSGGSGGSGGGGGPGGPGGGAVLLPPRVTSSWSASMLSVAPPTVWLCPPRYWCSR